MRGWTSTIVIVICAVVAVVLFHFLFKKQMDKQIGELRAQADSLHSQLEEINRMESQIPALTAQVPGWRNQVRIFKSAIPSQIEDDVFFRNLADELARNDVQLMSIQVNPGGPWLGNLKDEDAEKLAGIGVDVDAARNLKVAFYQVKLLGSYAHTVELLENLKRHGRMYSIDEVTGPAGEGGGTVMSTLDDTALPLQVSGKIFYGIPADYVSEAKLDAALQAVVFKPLAARLHGGVRAAGREVAEEYGVGAAPEGED
jgi:hypothetical protein